MDCPFTPGEILSLQNESFVIEGIIGRGASSIVYRARRRGMHTEHLLKEYHPQDIGLYRDGDRNLHVQDPRMRKRFQDGLARFKAGYDIQIRLRSDHETLKNNISNVQNIYEGYGTSFIEMTVFSGKSYDQVAERSLKELLLRVKAITRTVSNIHKAGYLLLDIKPANIFTAPDQADMIMLFDFDSAVKKRDIIDLDDWEASSTRGWCAPELMLRNYKECINEKTDVYAIGMILYHKLTGNLLKETGAMPPKNLMVCLGTVNTDLPLLKSEDESILQSLVDLLSHTLCHINYRWSTEKLIASLDRLITELDRIKFAADQSAKSNPPVPVPGHDVEKVEKQISKLHITILVALILICLPIYFLCFGSLLPAIKEAVSETAETQSDLQKQENVVQTMSQSTAPAQYDPVRETEPSAAVPSQGEEKYTTPASLDNQEECKYVIDTIAHTSDNFRSLIITNAGVVYYLDGNTVFNATNGIRLDMQTDFYRPLDNGYLAYDPYNDIVYLLAGGNLAIYNISDMNDPKLVLDPDISRISLAYNSSVTPQIEVLPDGSLLVPADSDGTYRIDLKNNSVSQFSRIYYLQSPYYARVFEDTIMTLRGGDTEVSVMPLYGGQERVFQLPSNAPYEEAVCQVGNQILFYVNGIGACQIDANGAYTTRIVQDNIRVNDYQSLNSCNIWSISANYAGVIAFYDNTLKCIRCIWPK